MKKFLYVFTERDRDVLLEQQFILLKADAINNIYVFENKECEHFALIEAQYVQSDTLTF